MTGKLIGVDVGGTFTDIFAFDPATGEASVAKTPSTLDDQSRGFVAGVSSLEPDFARIATVVHGTTTGTNALLERKGARTGIITTASRHFHIPLVIFLVRLVQTLVLLHLGTGETL